MPSSPSTQLSPYLQFIGAYCLESDQQIVRYGLRLKAHHLNFFGAAHGGLIQSLHDAAMAQLARNLHLDQKAALTLQMQTYFLEVAGALDEELVVEATLQHQSLTLVVCAAVCLWRGEVVARSTAQFKLVKLQRQNLARLRRNPAEEV